MKFWINKWALVATSLFSITLPLTPLSAATPAINVAVDPRRDPTVQAVEEVMPSVVNIATLERPPQSSIRDEFFRQFLQPKESYSLGSGVIIDEEGYLLTNLHVVENARVIMVRLSNGQEREAEWLLGLGYSDVALLKIKAKPGDQFKPVRFAKEDDLFLGETVLALGNPFGLGGTVNLGILSSKTRRPVQENEPLDFADWLQTDAAINPGNSGGPLVNLQGELIGLNVAVYKEGQGIGFAIPMKRLNDALSEFFTPEHLGGLLSGARFDPATLKVRKVEEETPAMKGGLKVGDIVLRVNGKKPVSLIDLNRQFLASSSKSPVTLEVQRGNQVRQVKLQLLAEKSVFTADILQKKIGIMVEEVPAEKARELGLDQGALWVRNIDNRFPVTRERLPRGAVIFQVNGRRVETIQDAAKVLRNVPAGTNVAIDYIAVVQRGSWPVAVTRRGMIPAQ